MISCGRKDEKCDNQLYTLKAVVMHSNSNVYAGELPDFWEFNEQTEALRKPEQSTKWRRGLQPPVHLIVLSWHSENDILLNLRMGLVNYGRIQCSSRYETTVIFLTNKEATIPNLPPFMPSSVSPVLWTPLFLSTFSCSAYVYRCLHFKIQKLFSNRWRLYYCRKRRFVRGSSVEIDRRLSALSMSQTMNPYGWPSSSCGRVGGGWVGGWMERG